MLYSDGVTEASNHLHEQFGLERLQTIIEARSSVHVEEICTAVIDAAKAWSPTQGDDMTIFVARFIGAGKTLRSAE